MECSFEVREAGGRVEIQGWDQVQGAGDREEASPSKVNGEGLLWEGRSGLLVQFLWNFWSLHRLMVAAVKQEAEFPVRWGAHCLVMGHLVAITAHWSELRGRAEWRALRVGEGWETADERK